MSSQETTEFLKNIDTAHVVGLRDRALIGVMVYAFARVSAVVSLKVEDYFPLQKRWWLRLKEKGGEVNEMGCHHKLEQYLDEYIAAAGIAEDKKGPLFRGHRPDGQAVHVARRCMVYGAPTGAGCGHRDGNRQSFFPGHRYHGLSGTRRRH
jgi:site-specific recombinase XerC